MDEPMILSISNVSVTYNRSSDQEFRALQKLNLEMKAAEFVVLLGANGSGKSTLLNVLAGHTRPDSGAGSIMLDGADITRKQSFKRSAQIGRVFQQPSDGIAAELSVLDNFRLAALRGYSRGLRIGTTATFRKLVEERIAILGMGLEDKLDRAAGSFSGGQRQALSLLMATFNKPKLLLLDEPTAALDPKSAEIVFELACSIICEHQITAIMVTHDLRHCLRAGSRIIQLHEGQIKHDISGLEKQQITLADIQAWFS
jgi:putative ABC transport system ATP-binding protein